MKLATILLLVLYFSVGCHVEPMQELGDEMVAKVEQFRLKENRLPKSLSELGVKETEAGPIYYKQTSESRYELWYGTGLGESVTYDSDNKTWK